MDMNIRDRVQSTGYSSIANMEKNLVKSLNKTDEMSQLDLIKLQQQTASYSNTISMMSTMLKNLADTEKEVIRNV